MSAASPNCCTASKEARTVRVFVPMGNFHGAHWTVPIRTEDGTLVTLVTTSCRFCPFCGVRLSRDHLSFDENEYMTCETREEYEKAMARSEKPVVSSGEEKP